MFWNPLNSSAFISGERGAILKAGEYRPKPRRPAGVGCAMPSIRPQQAVACEILARPQRNPGAVVDRIDRDYGVRFRE